MGSDSGDRTGKETYPEIKRIKRKRRQTGNVRSNSGIGQWGSDWKRNVSGNKKDQTEEETNRKCKIKQWDRTGKEKDRKGAWYFVDDVVFVDEIEQEEVFMLVYLLKGIFPKMSGNSIQRFIV